MRIIPSTRLAFSEIYLHPFIRIFAQVIWNESSAGKRSRYYVQYEQNTTFLGRLVGWKERAPADQSLLLSPPHLIAV